MVKLIGLPMAFLSVTLLFTPYNVPFYPTDMINYSTDGLDGILASSLPEVRGAVCKVELPNGGHGSGVGFRKIGNVTHVLTAKHVVEMAGKGAIIYIRYTQQTSEIRETAEVGEISRNHDLAIVLVTDSHLKVVPLDMSFDYKNSVGKSVFAVGFPRDIFPVLISFGEIKRASKEYLDHDATIFFGNSGGALISVETGKLIGINVMIRGRYGMARADEAIAVCIASIIEFINKGA